MLDIRSIVPGVISFMDFEYLEEDVRISVHPRDTTVLNQIRPMVCIYTRGDFCVWVALTKQFSPHRIKIENEWKTGRRKYWRKEFDPKWVNEDSYFQDLRRMWYGPKKAFQHASISKHADKSPIGRRMVTKQGVEVALAECKKFFPLLFVEEEGQVKQSVNF